MLKSHISSSPISSWRQTCVSRQQIVFRPAQPGGNASVCLERSTAKSNMGKRNRLRQARRQQAESNVCAVLAAHSKRKNDPAVAVTYGDLAPDYRAKIEAYRSFALRPPETW